MASRCVIDAKCLVDTIFYESDLQEAPMTAASLKCRELLRVVGLSLFSGIPPSLART